MESKGLKFESILARGRSVQIIVWEERSSSDVWPALGGKATTSVTRACMPDPAPAPGVWSAEKTECFERQAKDKDLHDCGYTGGGRGTF